MQKDVLTLEGSVPTLKEIIRSIILHIPGSAVFMAILLISVLYLIWSSIKAGVYYSKGEISMRDAYVKGFYKSCMANSPVCITRTLYVCALVLAFLLCAFRGIIGMIYVSLP